MKLTNEIRERMINKIMAEKFDNQTKELSVIKSALADEIYADIKGIGKVEKLPPNWFICQCSFTAYFNGERDSQTMSIARPLPKYVYDSGLKFSLDHPFTQQWIIIKQQDHELYLAKKALREELKKLCIRLQLISD